MLSLRQIICFATAVVSVVAVDATTVQTDLQTVDTSFKNLTPVVNNFDGTGAGLVRIISAFNQINRSINTTVDDTKAAPPFPNTQSQTILNYVNNPLTPDIKTSLTAIKNKKAALTSNQSYRNVIVKLLTDTKGNLDRAFSALIAKSLTAAVKSGLQTAKNNLDAAFDDTINFVKS